MTDSDAQTSPFLIRTSRAILHVSHSPQKKVIRASLIIVPCSFKLKKKKKNHCSWVKTRETGPFSSSQGNMLQLRFPNCCKRPTVPENVFHKRELLPLQRCFVSGDKILLLPPSFHKKEDSVAHLNPVSQPHVSPDGCHASRQTSQAAVFSVLGCSVAAQRQWTDAADGTCAADFFCQCVLVE